MESLNDLADDCLLQSLRPQAALRPGTGDHGRVAVLEELIIQLYTLYQISKSLNIATQLEEIFNASMELIDDYLHVHEYCLFLLEDGRETLAVKVSHGFRDQDVAGLTFAVGEGITGTAALCRETILVADVSADKRYLGYKRNIKTVGSLLCIPLLTRAPSRELIGVLNVHKAASAGFSREDLALFAEIAADLASAIEKARLYEATRELSMRDPLTALYNRRFFNDHLEAEFARAKRYGRTFSLLMLDIDHFKSYNDANGHRRGDEALIKTATILTDNLRRCDLVARYGGEEFVVLLPEIDHEGAMMAADNVRKAVAETGYFNERALPLGNFTVSIGVATYPGKAESAIDLVDYADQALYAGKARGRNVVCD